MKRVTAYQTTDGKIFADRTLCKIHQAGMDRVIALRVVADSFETALIDHPDNCGELTPDLVGVVLVEFLNMNADIVLKALNGIVPTDAEYELEELRVSNQLNN